MRPRINIITLGIRDLKESRAFYEDGLPLATITYFLLKVGLQKWVHIFYLEICWVV